MADWSDIAYFVGEFDLRSFGIQMNFRLPEGGDADPASDRQADAVRLFYKTDFGQITATQAHILLSCREYARHCGQVIFKQYPFPIQHLAARALAAFILRDPEILGFAVKWNERNFARGTGSPRVRGTQFFTDIESFASYLEGSWEMAGWNSVNMRDLSLA